MAQIVSYVELIQSVVAANRPWLKPLSGTLSIKPQDSLLFITGGYGFSYLSSTETYPRSSDCSPPSLPLARHGHTTFVTSEPTALVATCGGYTEDGDNTDSCLVLDPINQQWDESRMGSLTRARGY